MSEKHADPTVTVGHSNADFIGDNHRPIQAAVDHVSSLGGGTVHVKAGTYRMGNAVHLRDRVRVVGEGERTVLLKNASQSTRLTDDTDWYDWHAEVEDPSIFEVGGGVALQCIDPHGGGSRTNVTKHTVVAIEGNTVWLDSQPRKNIWITHEATASTRFPILTANWAKDLAIENITLDGNREANANFNGNYGGCIFMQDCERVRIAGVAARHYDGDGISWQICHDVTVEDCESFGHAGLGLHPGSGSQRPVIRNNTIRDCDIGLFWCWGVKHGLAEDNEIRNSGSYGVSIGHRDTDNVMRNNRIYDSGKVGIYFRPDDPAVRCAHRNVVEDCLVENAGTAEAPGVGIDLAGAVAGVVLRNNRIVNPDGGHMATGIRIGEAVTELTLEGNDVAGVACEVEDRRERR